MDGTSFDYILWDTNRLQHEPNTTFNRYCAITDGGYVMDPPRSPWMMTVCNGSYCLDDSCIETLATASFVCQQRPQSSSKEFEIKQYERNNNALQTPICSATCPDGWNYFLRQIFVTK